ncbi:hypothetical protein [Pseudonocardia nigra]|uniref:hypothetical protein n=1 Tax=Pseudonocardia nigra TaxID=1921578 RepID=UPI001C5F1691|nr:hypothetical protein [Pseudonocardia nigra]
MIESGKGFAPPHSAPACTYLMRWAGGIAPRLFRTAARARGIRAAGRRVGGTLATPHQARVFMAADFSRILLANELVDRAFAREVVGWLAGDEARSFYCYVDSGTVWRCCARRSTVWRRPGRCPC